VSAVQDLVDRLYFEVIQHRREHGQDPTELKVSRGDRLRLAMAYTCPLVHYDTGAQTVVFMGVPVSA
jgi:hypothetical protein